MIPDTDKAYIAGLFDGEGSINFTRRPERKKKHKGKGYRISNSMRISMEIAMTDQSVLMWLHEVLGVGTLIEYRWRCTFRDAYYVCLLIWPWAHTKLPKIQKILEHYADKKIMNNNVVSLDQYRKAMSLE